jgi:hypothetical protein
VSQQRGRNAIAPDQHDDDHVVDEQQHHDERARS